MSSRNSLIASSVANAHIFSLATSIKTQTAHVMEAGCSLGQSFSFLLVLKFHYSGVMMARQEKNAIIKINLLTSLLMEGLQRIEWPTAKTASGSSRLWPADFCPVHLQSNHQNTLSHKNSCITNFATSVHWLIAAYRSPAGYSFDLFSTNNPIFCRILSLSIVVLNIKSYHKSTKIMF